MIPENYLKMSLKSPAVFEGKFSGKSALIIGTGLSTKNIVKYKHKINEKFEVIIGLNFSTIDFEENLTHHLVIEKNPVAIYKDMANNQQKYRKDLPRVLNFKGLHRYPKYLNIMKTTRTDFGGKPEIRKYNNNNCEGLLNGPVSKEGFSVGTVALQAIHLACIMGCNKIYTIGVDLVFGEKFDHYYEDNAYRKGAVGPNKSAIVRVKDAVGVEHETTRYFSDSAAYIDKVIHTMCKPAGIELYTFSGGLVAAPIKLDIDSFFGEK